jgi:hypothetical protein
MIEEADSMAQKVMVADTKKHKKMYPERPSNVFLFSL